MGVPVLRGRGDSALGIVLALRARKGLWALSLSSGTHDTARVHRDDHRMLLISPFGLWEESSRTLGGKARMKPSPFRASGCLSSRKLRRTSACVPCYAGTVRPFNISIRGWYSSTCRGSSLLESTMMQVAAWATFSLCSSIAFQYFSNDRCDACTSTGGRSRRGHKRRRNACCRSHVHVCSSALGPRSLTKRRRSRV